MYYTIARFYGSYEDRLKLVCGESGLANRITSAGILDYEFLPHLRGKYQHSNFQKDQLIITTFLYAKDNEHLILDAVKQLVSKGCSGLVIKNVFGLQISDTVIRYADAKGFPIFLSDSNALIFEDFIVDVTARIRQLESLAFAQQELDAAFAEGVSENEVFQHARNLNPSFKTQHFAIYLSVSGQSAASWTRYFQLFQGSALDQPEHLLTMYDGGLVFIYTWEREKQFEEKDLAGQLAQILSPEGQAGPMGFSEVHFYLGELRDSFREAFFAARTAKAGDAVSFRDLGSLRILFPYCRDKAMTDFSESVLERAEDYDVENNAHLLDTLAAYCENEYSFSAAAKAMEQHENTIRYRLDKITELTGLSYKKPSQMQQLDLAYRIRLCRSLL